MSRANTVAPSYAGTSDGAPPPGAPAVPQVTFRALNGILDPNAAQLSRPSVSRVRGQRRVLSCCTCAVQLGYTVCKTRFPDRNMRMPCADYVSLDREATCEGHGNSTGLIVYCSTIS